MSVRSAIRAFAVAVVVAHVAVLATLGSSRNGVLYSNLLQLLSALLVLAAYAQVASRVTHFARAFTSLTAACFALWSFAQVGWLYQEAVRGTAVQTTDVINIVFFFFMAPLVAALFFPAKFATASDIWTLLLDLLQLGIAMLSAYAFFFYAPSFWADNTQAMDAAIRVSSEWRNWILLLIFLVVSYMAQRRSVRFLCTTQLPFLLLYAVGESAYFHSTRTAVINTGKWFDLVWSVPFLASTLMAGSITQVRTDDAPAERGWIARTTALHLLPGLIPLLIVGMAYRATRQQAISAMAAVAISFVCFAARLFITQRATMKAILAVEESEQIFRELASLSALSNAALFDSFAVALCRILGVRYVIVGKHFPQSQSIGTLALAMDGKLQAPVTYPLADTPCQRVTLEDFCHFEHDVAKLFPYDDLLKQMGADSYMGRVLRSSDGEPLGIVVAIHDSGIPNAALAENLLRISSSRIAVELENLRGEDELAASEHKFAAAFNQSPVMGVIVQLPERIILEVSDSFLEFYGATREQVTGRTGIELGLWADMTARDRLMELIKSDGRVKDLEADLRNRNGDLRRVIINGEILDSEKNHWLITTQDITAETQAREQLLANERRYRDLFENANDVIFTTDLAGQLVSVNRKGRELLRMAEAQLRGLAFGALLTESSRQLFNDNLANLGESSEVSHPFEVMLASTQQQNVRLELTIRHLLEDGVVTGAQGIARDVTERRLLEQQLVQAQKMEAIGTLAGGIAHDFNNLLTVITGYCQLLRDSMPGETAVIADLDEIDNAAKRAAALTGHLLTFSRRGGPGRGVVDLNFAVRAVEKMLRRVIGEHIELRAVLGNTVEPILADPSQMDQILMNLAINARDAMPAGGTLTFRTSSVRDPLVPGVPLLPGLYMVLQVQDNGTGMDQSTVSRIFEPFFTTKEVGRGTGLGLSTVYGIVQECGGGVAVESEPGRGTTFTLYFPVAEEQAREVAVLSTPEKPLGSETILLVEDDDALRTLASKILRTCGYRMILASRPEQAVALIDEFAGPIDLMVTDMIMPGGTGVDLMLHAKKVRPAMKMFAISGYNELDLPPDVIVMAKPFSPIELAARVRDYLDD